LHSCKHAEAFDPRDDENYSLGAEGDHNYERRYGLSVWAGRAVKYSLETCSVEALGSVGEFSSTAEV
jgi:hypothetical protein